MRRAVAGLALLTALTGCGASSPADTLTALTADVTRTANDEDAAGLREAADALADEVRAQREDGSLAPGEAEQLLALAAELRAKADRIDPEVARREAEEREAAERAAADRAAAEKAAAEKAAAERAAQDRAAEEEAAKKAEEAAKKAAEEAEKQDEDAGDDDDDGKGKGKGDKGED